MKSRVMLAKKLSSLSLALILTFSSLIFPVYSKLAKINSEEYISVEKIYEAQTDRVVLLINELDLKLDSEITNTRQIRFLLDASSLMTKVYPQTIKIKAYTKAENNKESILSIINSTIFNSKQAISYKFSLNIPASFNSNEVLIDVYDADGKLQASFKQYIEQNSSQETEVLQAADCSKEEFGDCQLQYILNAISYQARPSKNRDSVITKEKSGNYTVSLPFIRSKTSRFIAQGPIVDDGTLDDLSAAEVVSLVSQGNFSFEQVQLKAKELNTESVPADGTLEFDGEKMYLVKNSRREELGRQGAQGPEGPAGPTGPAGTPGSSSGTDPIFSNTATMNGVFKLIAQDDPPSSPAAGDIYHDTSPALCMYLGGVWQKVLGSGTCTSGTDQIPSAFNFTDSSAESSTLTSSNIITITGFDSAPISISGQGSPMYRIDSGIFTASAGIIYAGQTVQLRLMSNSSLGQSHTATLTVGGVSDDWVVTSMLCPENFAHIPGSAGVDSFGNSNGDFANGWCVSKYEMSPQGTSLWTRDSSFGWHYQNSSGAGKAITAKGGANSFPIAQITRDEAAAACANDLTTKDGTPLANGKLLTVYFWSNIAQAIVDDGINWSGGIAGSGNLSRGNGNSAGPLEGVTEGYSATQPTGGIFYYLGDQGRAWRMGLNEDTVYDWAGNVNEWFDDLHNNVGPSWDDIDASVPAYQHDNPNGPANVSVIPSQFASHDNTTNGVGRIYVSSTPLISGTVSAPMYGGGWASASYVGVFMSFWSIYSPSSGRYNNIGFRCIIPAQ